MFTTGHLAILKAVIAKLLLKTEDISLEFDDLENINIDDELIVLKNPNIKTMLTELQSKMKNSTIDFNSLVNGLAYPDFPCSTINDINMFMEPKLCSLLKMVKKMSTEYFSLAYTSHNGAFSMWHSMTSNPSYTLGKVVNDILSEIEVFTFMSAVDTTSIEPKVTPNIFWIGVILHVVMDSYSKAHTFRATSIADIGIGYDNDCTEICEDRKATIVNEIVTAAKQYVDNNPQKDKVDGFIIDTFTKSQFQEIFNNDVNRNGFKTLVYYMYFIRQQGSKMNIFTGAQSKSVDDDFNVGFIDDMTPTNNTRSGGTVKKKPEKVIPLVTVYYYPCQDGMFHKMNDRLSVLKKDKTLFDACVDDCVYILSKFLTFAHDIMYKTVDPRSTAILFIDDIKKYATDFIFKMHPQMEKAPTDYKLNKDGVVKKICSIYTQGGGEKSQKNRRNKL